MVTLFLYHTNIDLYDPIATGVATIIAESQDREENPRLITSTKKD